MNYCPNCGQKIGDYNFCPYCGSELKKHRIVDMPKQRYIPPTLPPEIEGMIAAGKSYNFCEKELRKHAEYSMIPQKELKTLVFTAGTKIMAEQLAKKYGKNFDYYQISPCGEGSCKLCMDLAKKRFRFSERKAGVNFPPFHDGCRCSFVFVEPENWDEWMDEYVRKHKRK